jgi:integrase
MAAKEFPTGIRPHGSGIKIRFTWEGQRYEPIWPRKPTKFNISQAASLRAELTAKAKYGTLTWQELAEHFPQYDQPEYINSTVMLFSEYAQIYLDSAPVSDATRDEYRKLLMRYWQPLYATRPIDSFTVSELKSDVANIEWSSMKTRNNALTPLRKVFELAVDDEVIERNPAEKLKNMKHQKPEVDPFSRQEAEQIIDYLYHDTGNEDRIYGAYIEFAFWTGMRTSEILALTWKDIDWHKGIARVSKARSRGRLNQQTKTKKTREVFLNDSAIHALKEAHKITGKHGNQVFRSPRTGQAWLTDKPPRIAFTAALKTLGIRHRRTYNTRHTYATQCLMAGMTPAFVANQLGHSVIVLLSTYAKWLHGEESTREMAKLKVSLEKG